MDWSAIGMAFTQTFDPINIFYVILGVVGGIAVGALPGMTSVMLLAIILPFTYTMNPVGAVILLVGICSGANYGGGITAILFNTPGTPSAAATALDGYPMSRQGRGGEALLANIFSSFIGGCIAWLIMTLATPLISKFALLFGPCEYAMLLIWSLTIIGMLTGGDAVKGIIAGVVGLALSTIGMEPYAGKVRYTMGLFELFEGIDVVWASIGLFALLQVLKYVPMKSNAISATNGEKISYPVMKTLKLVLKKKWLVFKSAVIGTFIGAAPGAGPVIASFLAYGEAKRSSEHPETFGKGNVEGVIASEAANNACGFGSMIPMLALGIPGSTASALTLAAMIVVGLTPGPEFFTKHAVEAYTIFGGGMLSNVVFLFFGLFFAKYCTKLLNVKVAYLIPLITMLATIGVYAPDQSVFGMYTAFAFCVLGLCMDWLGFPIMPLLLGLILGGIMESHFVRAMIMTRKNIGAIFFYSPICTILTIITIITILSVILRSNPKFKNRLFFWKKNQAGKPQQQLPEDEP